MTKEMKEFSTAVTIALKDFYPDKTFEVKDYKKNNCTLTGIHVTKGHGKMEPIIYLDGYLKDYQNDKITFQEVLENIRETYEESKIIKINLDGFEDYEQMKKNLFIHAFHETNEKEDWIKIRKNDLVGAVYLRLDGGGIISAVTQKNLEMWGKTEKEVILQALVNQSPKFTSMSEILKRMTGRDFETAVPMYILTNKDEVNGAGLIFNDMILEDIRKKIGDYYILPSSIHEVIIVPIFGNEREGLSDMVKEVNETAVSIDERLSDHAYMYDGEFRSI